MADEKKKILFLGSGSKNDPGFENVKIGELPYKQYMGDHGITVVEGVVESCHGCPTIVEDYSKQIENLQFDGHRIVAVLEGGLLFGLPSMQAAQTTIPIISCPLDLVAYTAYMVPPGHAVIASVGVEYGTSVGPGLEKYRPQKPMALTLAEKILNLEDTRVSIIDDVTERQLAAELGAIGIEYAFGDGEEENLKLSNGYSDGNVVTRGILIRNWDGLNTMSWDSISEAERMHHKESYEFVPTAHVRGLSNLAIFAAKIISLQRPELRDKLLAIADHNYSSYLPERMIDREIAKLK